MAIIHDASGNPLSTLHQADTLVSMAPAANTGGTLTLPAPGVGLFHYVTSIRIVRAASAAVTGNAILTITTTNLAGNPSLLVGNLMAAGATQIDLSASYHPAIKSAAANVATTFVFPAPGVGVQWSVLVTYFAAP